MSQKWPRNDTGRPDKYDGFMDISRSYLRPEVMRTDEREHRSSREVTPINFEDVYQSPRKVFSSHIAQAPPLPSKPDWQDGEAADSKVEEDVDDDQQTDFWWTKFTAIDWRSLAWLFPLIIVVFIWAGRGTTVESSQALESRVNALTKSVSELLETQNRLEATIRSLQLEHNGMVRTHELDERMHALDSLSCKAESVNISSQILELISKNVRQEFDRYLLRPHEHVLDENLFVLLDRAIQRMKDQCEASLRSKLNRLSLEQGALVSPSLTSPTYTIFEGCNRVEAYFREKVYRWRHDKPLNRSPSLILGQSLELNQTSTCWPFKGARGTIGFKLVQRVRPTHFVVVHAPKYRTPDIGSAPRLVSLWAKVKSMYDRDVLSSMVSQDGRGAGVEIPPEFMKLASAVYSVHGADPVQFFEIPAAVRSLNLETSSLVIAVESNWGNPDYTCLYGLGLYGDV